MVYSILIIIYLLLGISFASLLLPNLDINNKLNKILTFICCVIFWPLIILSAGFIILALTIVNNDEGDNATL